MNRFYYSLRNIQILNIVLVFFLFSSLPVKAQEKSFLAPVGSDFRLALQDGGKLFTQPLRWEAGQWLLFGAVAGGTYLLTTVDDDAQRFVYRHPGYSKSFPIELGRWTGEPLTTISISGGLYIWGLAADNEEIRSLGFEVAESFVYAGAITTILKHSFGRWRPYTHKGTLKFLPFSLGSNDHLSLPSGHATLAFSLTTVLASHVDDPWLKTLIYVPAVLTMVSRVYHDQHWVSDVFLGASIGYFTGKFITGEHRKDKTGNSAIEFGFSPDRIISYTYYF